MDYQFLGLELCHPEIPTCEDPLHSSVTCLHFSHSFTIRNKQPAVDGRSEGRQTSDVGHERDDTVELARDCLARSRSHGHT